jgi:hypothetical protein
VTFKVLEPKGLADAGYGAIRVIADVHGMWSELRPLLEEARDRRLFVVQLGDLCDRGPQSPECLRAAMDMALGGWGTWLPGNHDWKLIRKLRGRNVKYNPDGSGLGRTLRQLEAHPDGPDIAADLMEQFPSHFWIMAGRHGFAHAAFVLGMWDHELDAATAEKKYRDLSLYGETDGTVDADGFPTRKLDWVRTVPSCRRVIVGHSVLSTDAPVTMLSDTGSQVIFLDTGAGKMGKEDALGKLSHLDIPIEDL